MLCRAASVADCRLLLSSHNLVEDATADYFCLEASSLHSNSDDINTKHFTTLLSVLLCILPLCYLHR